MKIAFISDIHGNATALEAVLKDIEGKKVDKIYILGDICFRGPEPKLSLDFVRSLKADVIKGNADEWVVRGVQQGEVPDAALEMMNKERDWAVSKLSENDMKYLETLPTELILEDGGIQIHAFHATPGNLFEVVTPNTNDEELITKMMKENADIYIYGHIHKPYIRYINGKCIMNIGSVGLPFDGLPKASYGLVEVNGPDVNTTIVRVSYDLNKVIKNFSKSNYPNKELMKKILTNASV